MKPLLAAAFLALALGATASPAEAMLKGHWVCSLYKKWASANGTIHLQCLHYRWVADPQIQSFEPHRPFPGPPHAMFFRPRPMLPFGPRRF